MSPAVVLTLVALILRGVSPPRIVSKPRQALPEAIDAFFKKVLAGLTNANPLLVAA